MTRPITAYVSVPRAGLLLLATEPTPQILAKVEAEMTRLLYRSAGFGLFSNFVLGLVLVAGSFPYHPLRRHLLWLDALFLVSAGRFGINLAFESSQPPAGGVGALAHPLPRWPFHGGYHLGMRRLDLF